MRLILALWIASLSLTAQAVTQGNTLFLGTSTRIAIPTAGQQRDVFICFLTDIHNIISEDDEVAVAHDSSTCMPVQDPTNCSGSYCTQSPYCSSSWFNTGGILLKSLAAELTGRFGDIDYTLIQGNDVVQSHWKNALDHPRCDAIISLGDNADLDDVGVIDQLPTEAGLLTVASFQNGFNQWQRVKEFWTLIKASGIPFLPILGNHDPEVPYRSMMDVYLNFTALPFYYGREPTRQNEYAIKFSTGTGRQFCVIAYNSSSTHGTAVNTVERDWVEANVGCGATLPTIVVLHEGGGRGANAVTLAHLEDNAAAKDVFLEGSAHLTPGGGFFTFGSESGAGAFTVYRTEGNWQEQNRKGTGFNYPYGNTPSDSDGGFYIVTRIDPVGKTICSWSWSTYFQVRSNSAGNFGQGCQAFDFDARSW